MSCFIVSSDCMQRVVTGALLLADMGSMHTLCGVTLSDRHDFMANVYAGPKLWTKLYDLNEKAFVGRYQDRHQESGKRPVAEYADTVPHKRAKLDANELVAVAKAVQSFVYQCAEDGVADSQDFAELEVFTSKMNALALKHHPAYEAAAWG